MSRFLILAALATFGAPAVQAQEVSLNKLISLASLPPDLTASQNQEASLGEWVFHPACSVAENEPLTWGWWPLNESAGTLPSTLLSLRPNHGTLDVVVHLRRAPNFNQLHRELLRHKAVSATTPVTCLGCTGERFTTPTFSIYFYQGKPDPYPFIVVLHRIIEAPASGVAAPTGRISSAHLPTP
jgi:hypothetical protein